MMLTGKGLGGSRRGICGECSCIRPQEFPTISHASSTIWQKLAGVMIEGRSRLSAIAYRFSNNQRLDSSAFSSWSAATRSEGAWPFERASDKVLLVRRALIAIMNSMLMCSFPRVTIPVLWNSVTRLGFCIRSFWLNLMEVEGFTYCPLIRYSTRRQLRYVVFLAYVAHNGDRWT